MTIEELQIVGSEAGKMAERLSAGPQQGIVEPTVRVGLHEASQSMQVKMLAEIALQLRIMNDGNGAKQPED